MIRGFGFTGYRSFHGELQLIGPLSKVNLLAGQNNAGKSNIIRFISSIANESAMSPQDLDIPQVPGYKGRYEWALAIDENGPEIERARNRMQGRFSGAGGHLDSLLKLACFRLTGDDLVWFRFDAGGEPSVEQLQESAKDRNAKDWASLLSEAITGQRGGQPHEDALRVVRSLKIFEAIPKVVMVDAFRQIRREATNEPVSSGYGLIDQLSRLQNPDTSPTRQVSEQKFREINQFLRVVLEDPDTELKIPYSRNTIQVVKDGRLLPLEHYGTGIHQVIILAAIATVEEGALVCIEEPEVHLHPLLQRKLIRFLGSSSTSNTYLISTHSAHMLDLESASISDIRLGDQGTVVTSARSPSCVSSICANLGYRASDILQANSVIWVEGPSDRVYLRSWIRLLAPDLIEGIHFSLMFYGGRLLSHLTASDDEIGEFIQLRKLNRNVAIVIDSDKTSAQKPLSATKKRVIDEFEAEYSGSSWVTDGYTIENLVTPSRMNDAILHFYGDKHKWNGNKWTNPLPKKEGLPRFDKVKIAHYVMANWAASDFTKGLRRRVEQMVTLIRDANDG